MKVWVSLNTVLIHLEELKHL